MITGSFRGFEVAMEDAGIVIVTFNEPERLNGMTVPMKRDLIEVLTQAQMADYVRVVVFTGTGRAFSAGDDISGNEYASDIKGLVPEIPEGFHKAKHHALGTYGALRWHSQQLNLSVRNLDKLTIAAVNGFAIQTGLSLALACDFRIASTDARLGSGTLRFGLMPDEGGHYLLLQYMGLGKTMEFLMRNRIVSAAEAQELGLVHEVVPPDDLMPRARQLAHELAEGPQLAMRFLKRALYNAADMTLEQALEDIASKTAVTDPDPDAREGIAAWREKRAPEFNQWLRDKA